MTRRLAHEAGMLVGPSAGANVAAALDVARSLDAGVVVTILCDTGTRYLSDDFWEGES
jgi:cysteine synthase B